MRRTVTCIDTTTGKSQTDSKCTQVGLIKPETSRACNNGPCSLACLDKSRDDCGSYWSVSAWSSCTRECGFGKQTRTVKCRRISNDGALQDRYCGGSKPQTVTDCNAYACPKYVTHEWAECNADCDDGIKTRKVTCEDYLGREVDEVLCSGTRPASQTACNERPCAHWHKNLWEECTTTCGGGIRRRSMDCRLPHDGVYLGVKVVPHLIDDICPDEKPPVEEPCNTEPCGAKHWVTTEWSECSRSCKPGEKDLGLAIHTRDVWCVDTATGTRTFESECLNVGLERPETERSCEDRKCPTYEWGVVNEGEGDEWGTCDKQCGGGVQRRIVQCRDTTGDVVFGYEIPFEVVEDKYCAASDRPAETRPCNTEGSSLCGDANGRCSASGKCECAPGWGFADCTSRPSLTNVVVDVNEKTHPTGVPGGSVVEVTWEHTGGIGKIDVFLNVPGKDIPVALTPPERYPNQGVYLATMPVGIPAGDGYTITVYHTKVLAATSDTFQVADPCAYVSCGQKGVCNAQGKCDCLEFFSGESCKIDPCIAAGCYPNAVGVDTCDVNAQNGTVTCECNQGWNGEGCRHQIGCHDKCKNGGVARPIATLGFITNDGSVDIGANTEGQKCGECDCKTGTAWTGPTCETCPLSCPKGSTPNSDCTGCTCDSGWTGRMCQCGYFTIDMRLNLPEAARKNDEALLSVLKHDIMKSILHKVYGFKGSVDEVTFESCGGDCIEVSFHLAEECIDTPLGRRLSSPIPRRLEANDIKAAYDALYDQSKDEWSVFRSQGFVTSTFDTSFGLQGDDPTGRHKLSSDGGMGVGAIIGIAVGAVAVLSLLGAMYVKRDDFEFGNPFENIGNPFKRSRRPSFKLNDGPHVEIKHMDRKGGTQTYERPPLVGTGGMSYNNKNPGAFPAMPQMSMPPGVSNRSLNPMHSTTSSRPRVTKQPSNVAAYQPRATQKAKPALKPRPKRQPPLPKGWVAVTDEESGDTYWWNEFTDETTWDRPLPSRPKFGVQRL